MKIIVVADDFGVNASRSDGIIEAMLAGAVHSVSILANGLCSAEKLRCLKKAFPPLSPGHVGLHLNFTEGRALAGPSSLTDAEGFFVGKAPLRQRVTAGEVPVPHIQAEATAQVQWINTLFGEVFGSGAQARHFDGHNHFHTQQELVAPLALAMSQLGFGSVRIPKDFQYPEAGVEVCRRSFASFAGQPAFHLRVAAEAWEAEPVYRSHGLSCSDVFCGLKALESCTLPGVSAMLREAAAAAGKEGEGGGIAEVMTHVGRALPEGSATEVPFHSDWFSSSRDRDGELAIWTSGEVLSALALFSPASFGALSGHR